MDTLINKIGLLSKKDREIILISEVLDQKRRLVITFKSGYEISFSSLNYNLKLCTDAIFYFEKFEDEDKFIFQYVMTEFQEKVSKDFHTFALNENFSGVKFRNAV